jgi:hypothetical protein
VNYDIDWISVRAAWRLEEITFQNFGYHEQTISEAQLMKLHQQNYSSYLQTGSHSVDFKNKSQRKSKLFTDKCLPIVFPSGGTIIKVVGQGSKHLKKHLQAVTSNGKA